MLEIGSPLGKRKGERGIVLIMQDRDNQISKSITVRGATLGEVFDEVYFHFKHLEKLEVRDYEKYEKAVSSRIKADGKQFKKVRGANRGPLIQEEDFGI